MIQVKVSQINSYLLSHIYDSVKKAEKEQEKIKKQNEENRKNRK